MPKNKKISDKQLDKEIAKEKKNSKKVWSKRWNIAQEATLIIALIGASIFSYEKGLFEISSEHLEAMIAMLVVVAISCVLLKKRV